MDFGAGVDFGRAGEGGFEVGLAGSEVEPGGSVDGDGTEAILVDGFQEGGDDGDFLVGGDEVEEFGADGVDAGELLVSGPGGEFLADVEDAIFFDVEVEVGAGGEGGEGGEVVGVLVGLDEFSEGEVAEDVSVVDEEGFAGDPGGDVFDAAAGFEEDFFVEESEGHSPVGFCGEGLFPGVGEVVGVDGDFFNSGGAAMVEGVGDEGAVE